MKTVLTFATMTTLLKAERCLRQQGIPYRIEPAPRKVTSDCGMAVVLAADAGRDVSERLAQCGVNCTRHEVEG